MRSYWKPMAALLAVAFAGACGSGMQPLGGSAPPEKTAAFSATLLGAGESATPLTVSQELRSGQTLLQVRSSQPLTGAALQIEVQYDPARFAPAAVQGTDAFAPLGGSLTLEIARAAGRVEFGQVCLGGTRGAAPAGAVLLEVLFAHEAFSGARHVSGVPSSSNAVSPLLWDAAASELRWFYVNPGDYDQNGEVGISDLMPLGQHFREAGPFPFETALSVIDGSPDGEINIADLTPIGTNFGNRVEGYNLYFSQDIADTPSDFAEPSTIAPLATMPFDTAQGAPETQRRFFSYTVGAGQPAGFYWVRPTANDEVGAASEGTRSNVNTGSPDDNPPPPDPGNFNVLPAADMHIATLGNSIPLDATLDASGSSDSDGEIVLYEWDFEGDGLFDAWSSVPGAKHTYRQAGTYAPRLRVIDNAGGIGLFTAPAFTATELTVSNIAPQADVIATAVAGKAPLTVGLLAIGSSDVDGAIAKYEWDFDGDGTYDLDSGNDPTVMNTYNTPGSFNAAVRVTDDDGATATSSIGITVAAAPANQLPTADLQSNVNTGNAPLAVDFDAAASADPDGSIVEYAWDFDGDGGYEQTSTLAALTHAYASPGVFDAKLRVTDDSGATATAQLTITVNVAGNASPVADLQASALLGTAPVQITFDAGASADSDGSIARYDYDFESDGIWDAFDGPSTVDHTFTAAGAYAVKLRVTDDDGAQHTASVNVNINAPGNALPAAGLTGTPLSGNAPLPVGFDASGSSDSDGSIARYDYDFNSDGIWDAFDAADTLSYTYALPGNYTAKVRVTDDQGAQDSATVAITVTAAGNSSPVADLTGLPLSGASPLSVSLSAAGSSDSDGSIVRYDYDFNSDGVWDAYDGPTSLSHVFTGAGNYTAKLRVTDDAGAQSTDTVSITVTGGGGVGGPTAGVTATPQNFTYTVPQNVVLDPSSSVAGSAPIARYDWDLDNDGFFDLWSGSAQSVNQTITGVSSHVYKLRVTDTNGQFDEATVTVTASGPPVAALGLSPAGPYGPNVSVTLDASTSSAPGSTITKYEFDRDANALTGTNGFEFDGGTTPTTTTSFPAAGDYTVRVRVTNAANATSIATALVQVRLATITTVDSTSTPGDFAAIAIIGGRPAMAYRRAAAHDVAYVRANDANGSTWGTPVIVANMANNSGRYVDLVEANGRPAVCYADNDQTNLYYLRADDATGANWTSALQVQISGNPSSTSMEIIGGNPAIAYAMSGGSPALMYRRATDTSGSAWGAAQTVNSGGTNPGNVPSLAEVNGLPAVAFFFWDSVAGVRYKRAGDLAGNSWATTVDISTNGTVNDSAEYPSLAVINGNPAVSYQVRADGSLRYRRGSNADGSAFGGEVTAASGAEYGQPNVLRFINNLPYIAYHDDTSDTLRLIIGADANGGTWQASNLLDSGPDGAGSDIDMVAIGTKAGIGFSATSGATPVAKFAFVP